MARPIYLVTDFRNVRMANPASRYSESAERLDLWKVGLAHGYYAGMGMDFFFPTQEEASRFTKWTIYDPSQIIAIMDNERFTVKGARKSAFMTAINPYTDNRALRDSWIVDFETDRGGFLQWNFPWEASARAYSVGRAYTIAELLGILPAMPRDVVAVLEAIAEQKRIEEEERKKREEEEANQPPVTPPTGEPPPTTPTTPPLTTEQQKQALAAQWWTITEAGAAGWYAGARLDAVGKTYAQAWPAGIASQYLLVQTTGIVTATFTRQRLLSPSWPNSIRSVVNDKNFEFFGFVVRI